MVSTIFTLLPCVVTNAETMTHHHHHSNVAVNNNNNVGKFTSSSSLYNGNSLIQSTTISDDLLSTDSNSPVESSIIRRSHRSMIAKIPSFVRRQTMHHSSHSNKVVVQSPLFANINHYQILTKLRGGGADEDATEYDEDSSSEEEEFDNEYDDEYDSEYDSTDDESEEEEEGEDNIVTSLTSSSLKSSIRSKSSSSSSSSTKQKQQIQVEYDEVLSPPSMQQLIISLGVMFLSQRIDILDTRTVRIARMAFVTYIIVMQVFLLYVRVKAKMVNDRTEITLSNPLASLVEGAAASAGGGAGGVGGGGGNFMVKALANQMLSTTTTIYEYDLQQAKKMNSGLLMPMIFLYFLHFKMKQVQPLLMQTATGVMNMVYSPLFQVYVLGRNLERPFKLTSQLGGNSNAMLDRMEAMKKENKDEEGGESGVANDEEEEEGGEKEEEEKEDGDYSEEEESDDEEEEEEESEYDSYEEEEE